MINSSSSSSSNPFLKSQAEGRLTTRTSRRRHRRTTSKSRLSRASRTWSGPSREARAPSTKIEAVETTIPRSTATVTMKSFLNRPSHQYRSLPISIKSQGKKKIVNFLNGATIGSHIAEKNRWWSNLNAISKSRVRLPWNSWRLSETCWQRSQKWMSRRFSRTCLQLTRGRHRACMSSNIHTR